MCAHTCISKYVCLYICSVPRYVYVYIYIWYIGQFQNGYGYGHSAHAVPTHQSSVNVLDGNIINISPFAENIDMFLHRLIFYSE